MQVRIQRGSVWMTGFHLDLRHVLETQVSTIEAAFQEFTERKDIAILLINQHVRLGPNLLMD
jgi:vacuolar-type H+-ATPase subunit F/Vma7